MTGWTTRRLADKISNFKGNLEKDKIGSFSSIQVCPEKGIISTILLWGWDWDHQTYSREGSGLLGNQKARTESARFFRS